MTKVATFMILLAGLLTANLQQGLAQTRIDIGPRAGFDIGDTEAFFVGADTRLKTSNLPITFNGAFDWYFIDSFGGVGDLGFGGLGLTEVDINLFQISFNALYEFGAQNRAFTPYVGAGLGIAYVSGSVGTPLGGGSASESETGFNVVGGAAFGAGGLRPFAQAQLTFGDVEFFTVGGGLLFSIGQ